MNAKVLKEETHLNKNGSSNKYDIWYQCSSHIPTCLIQYLYERWVNDILQVLYRSELIPCISQALFESRVFFLFPNNPSKWVQSHHMYVEYNWNLRPIHSSQHRARQQVQFMYHDPLSWKVCRLVISGFHTALGRNFWVYLEDYYS